MALYPQEADMFEVASMLSQKECKNTISIKKKKTVQYCIQILINVKLQILKPSEDFSMSRMACANSEVKVTNVSKSK
jgi:hypothetical protein